MKLLFCDEGKDRVTDRYDSRNSDLDAYLHHYCEHHVRSFVGEFRHIIMSAIQANYRPMFSFLAAYAVLTSICSVAAFYLIISACLQKWHFLQIIEFLIKKH